MNDLRNYWDRVIAGAASDRIEIRAEKRAAALPGLSALPGMKKSNTLNVWTPSNVGTYNSRLAISALDSADARMLWTARTRNMPISEIAKRERKKMSEQEASNLNDIDFILLNVSRNLWVGPDGPDGKPTYTNEAGQAKVLKRLPALDQFVEACKANAGDYDVPIRLQDLVSCSMGLDE